MMPRPRLTDLLARVDETAVVSIVAPAGYGKTTLLRQWADHVSNFGYVALEDRDNDPVELISGIATALDGIEPLDPTLLRMLGVARSINRIRRSCRASSRRSGRGALQRS